MMNGSEPHSTNSAFESLIEELRQQVADQEARVESLRAQIIPHEDELRRMRKMLNAAVRPEPRAQSRPKSGGRMGEEELRIALARLRDLPESEWLAPDIPGSFGTGTLRRVLGVSKSTSERMVNYLREQEEIRLVGERQGRGPHPNRVYVINEAPGE